MSATSTYLEIVTRDVEAIVELYEAMHEVTFGRPQPELGGARVAPAPDGCLIGIRAPLAGHEEPITRTYVAVRDIQKTVAAAEQQGATVAYPPTQQGAWGTFAIVIAGGVQHALWQR